MSANSATRVQKVSRLTRKTVAGKGGEPTVRFGVPHNVVMPFSSITRCPMVILLSTESMNRLAAWVVGSHAK